MSIFALQLAKIAGARVIATTSSEEKMARLKELGADDVINYREDQTWGETVLRLTEDRGVDHVIEVGGPSTLVQSIAATRVGGHIAVIGVLSGMNSELPLGPALARQVNLKAFIVGSRRHQENFVRAIEANGLRPIIDKHFAMEDMVEAFQFQISGQHFGKIVLDI